jgi:16S rRNA pseudouridine516 synthase
MKLLRQVANLGYGSRREVLALFNAGRIRDDDGALLYADDVVDPGRVRIDGQPLDPPAGLVLMLHKPTGITCSMRDPGRIVHDLLPPRFRRRQPALSTVGRLDRDTSGLLLLTDDGALLHRIISPRSQVAKVYEATLAADLRGDEGEHVGAGTLRLEGDDRPLAPAGFVALGPRRARLVLTEGRYHQVRRMFAALGNHVVTLHRCAIGALTLGGLEAGGWRPLAAAEIERVFAPPPGD